MILDWVLAFFSTVIAGLVSLIPAPVFVDLSSAVAAGWSGFSPVWSFADYVAPCHELVIMFCLIISMRCSGIVAAFVFRVIGFIPFIGGGG